MSDVKLNRKGFGLKKEVAGDLRRDYHSDLVVDARLSGGRISWPGFEIRIAKELGFCYGVERAIDYAYETRLKFPDRRVFLTSEIIHNPRVNERLRELGFQFLDGAYGSTIGWDELTAKDVVLLPAFGATTADMERLRAVDCLLVDTTCGSVLNVWKNVERFARDGFTCLIHGKYSHEETRATASRALIYPEGRYLVVLDDEETELVARFIEGAEPPNAILERFPNAMSPGFDPEAHLQRVGMANQTTMLSSESLAVAERIRAAFVSRYGEDEAAARFRSFDTICSATQDRQDAIIELMKDPPDVVLIVGGFNSSNTGHLCEICSESSPTYHVETADDLFDGTRIRHLPAHATEPVVTESWLPDGPLRVGVTAGASTPDRDIGRVIETLCTLRGLDLDTAAN